VTASPDSRGNPDFFLMVKPNCPSGQLTYDDFSIV